MTPKARARDFLENEKQFHLGALPTEQANPLTRGLSEVLKKNTEAGLQMLFDVDMQVADACEKTFQSEEYKRLLEALLNAIKNGRRICFSGCGATGRLSILLEAMWREFWQKLKHDTPQAIEPIPDREDAVISIMTGGDYALVKSVENFEDYQEFGRQQVREAGLQNGDILVAISEGGETSSVIGTIHEALDRKCHTFFLYNNPSEVLCENVERSRSIIKDERVVCIPLFSGPMAISGSTRMQATTYEMLVAGAALENALMDFLEPHAVNIRETMPTESPTKPEQEFGKLVIALKQDECIRSLARMVEYEEMIYRDKGRITYFASESVLDIFTDTTERAPTFMLPPFRKQDNKVSPTSWAFVKDPLRPTPEAWKHVYRRSEIRCLKWDREQYVKMNAPQTVVDNPPVLNESELMKFVIGNEDDPSRYEPDSNAALLVSCGQEAKKIAEGDISLPNAFDQHGKAFKHKAALLVGDCRANIEQVDNVFRIAADLPQTPLRLWEHLAIKLVLNTVSTATMGRMGKIAGNWMSCVEASNKKLIDRSTRLITDLAGISYEKACEALFESLEELQSHPAGIEKPSPVQKTLSVLKAMAFAKNNSDWAIGTDMLCGDLKFIHASEMKEKEIDSTWRKVHVKWQAHPSLGPDFTVNVSWDIDNTGLAHGGFSYSKYDSPEFIEEIHFPVIRCECESESGFLTGASDMGVIKHREIFSAGKDFTSRGSYSSMQFSALLNKSTPSIYFDHRDPAWYTKGYGLDISGNSQEFTYKGVFFVPNGKKPLTDYSVPYASACGEFSGGWFEAAQIYKKWTLSQSWHTGRVQPNPLRDIGLWVWNRGAIDTVLPPVKQLQDDCGDTPVALDWYWWHNNPYDSYYPDFWPPREGEDKFRAAVADLNASGIFTQVYINGVCWDMDGDTWNDGGENCVTIKRDGEPYNHAFNKYNHHRLGFMCGAAPEFHDRLSGLVKTLRQTGLNGQYLDMIGGAPMGMCCYNPKHDHTLGGGCYMVEGYRKLLARLKAENPKYPLSTEFCNEAYMDLIDSAIICMSASSERFNVDGDYIPLFTAVHHGKLALFGSYALFDCIPPWDSLWPCEDRWADEKAWHKLYPEQFFVEFSRPVVWGAQPMVCNILLEHCKNPEFAYIYKFIIDTAQFYHANRDYLFDGEMMSPDGFSCAEKEVEFMARTIFTKQDECKIIKRRLPVILHSCWCNPAGEKALFAVNYTAEKQQWQHGTQSGVMQPYSWTKLMLSHH